MKSINSSKVPMYAKFKGEGVSVETPPDETVQIAIMDAERIMGLRPTLSTENTARPEFLDPPETESRLYKYATSLLAMQPPIVEIWLKGPRLVSLSELRDIVYSDEVSR